MSLNFEIFFSLFLKFINCKIYSNIKRLKRHLFTLDLTTLENLTNETIPSHYAILVFFRWMVEKPFKRQDNITRQQALPHTRRKKYLNHFWKCNFPMNHNVCLSVCLSTKSPNYSNVIIINVVFF